MILSGKKVLFHEMGRGGGAAERGLMRKAFLGIGMLKKQVYFVK